RVSSCARRASASACEARRIAASARSRSAFALASTSANCDLRSSTASLEPPSSPGLSSSSMVTLISSSAMVASIDHRRVRHAALDQRVLDDTDAAAVARLGAAEKHLDAIGGTQEHPVAWLDFDLAELGDAIVLEGQRAFLEDQRRLALKPVL